MDAGAWLTIAAAITRCNVCVPTDSVLISKPISYSLNKQRLYSFYSYSFKTCIPLFFSPFPTHTRFKKNNLSHWHTRVPNMFSENWNCLVVIFNKANCVNSPLKRGFPFRAVRWCFNSCCTKWWLYMVPPPPPLPLQNSVYLVSKAAVYFSSFVSSLSLSERESGG